MSGRLNITSIDYIFLGYIQNQIHFANVWRSQIMTSTLFKTCPTLQYFFDLRRFINKYWEDYFAYMNNSVILNLI